MDTLGALALATEPPTDHLMARPPVGRRLGEVFMLFEVLFFAVNVFWFILSFLLLNELFGLFVEFSSFRFRCEPLFPFYLCTSNFLVENILLIKLLKNH